MRDLMKWLMLSVLFIMLYSSCADKQQVVVVKKKVDHWVGDITYDARTDISGFYLCDSTNINHRRSALNYKGGMNSFKSNVIGKLKSNYSYSGYIMVRFLLNCRNEMDRFRTHPLALDFSEQACPEGFQQQIVDAVKSMPDWERSTTESGPDCSKFLNFKIVIGEVVEILY